jgi:hypothetical protein
MPVERKPYELLVRWDAEGNLIGAHVQWSNVVKNDDGSKRVYPITVEPVALTAEGNGVPIADVLNEACTCRGTSGLGRQPRRVSNRSASFRDSVVPIILCGIFLAVLASSWWH